jgi:hypothetical protein
VRFPSYVKIVCIKNIRFTFIARTGGFNIGIRTQWQYFRIVEIALGFMLINIASGGRIKYGVSE